MVHSDVRPGLRRPIACVALTAALAGAALAQAPSETVIVQRGDTLSQIAARYTGDARTWRKLYDAQRSNIANPDLITVGMKLELVSEAGGARYLRAVSAGAPALATAAAPAAAPAAKPAPAAAPAAPPAPPPVAAAPEEPLNIGLLPNIGAAALMVQYDHLKRYLERGSGPKVRFTVPANFKAFFDLMMAGEVDVAVAAPNFARVAQLDRGWVPLGMYEPRIGALFVTPAEGGVTSAREVAGKAVVFANPQSLLATYGQQWLRGQNLEPGRDYEIKGARTDMGAGRILLTGEAVAGIMSNGEYRALPPDEASRLKIVEVFARIPNFIWVANPKLDRARAERLRGQLRELFADKEDGAAFARATGLGGFVDADDAILRELDPFVAPTRRAMGVTR